MRLRVMILLFGVLGILPVFAKNSDDPGSTLDGYLTLFLKDDKATSDHIAELKLFSGNLGRKKIKDDVLFLQHVFFKTHRKFLKQYQQSATFGETLSEGSYNCVTGVALYAILLKELGFNFRILETNHHIFLLVETQDKRLALYETTDPMNGFTIDENDIEKRLNDYREGQTVYAEDGKDFYEYHTNVYQEISLNQLRGLMYFNYAVEAYNRQDFPNAIDNFAKALEFYQSPRMDEFYAIISSQLHHSSLDTSTKMKFLKEIGAKFSPSANLKSSL